MHNLVQSEEMGERMKGRQSKSKAEAEQEARQKQKQKMANNHQCRAAE